MDIDLTEVFAADGGQIRYGVIGTGDPLVMVHGTPFSSVVWRRIAPYLAAHRRVYLYDLLGYGRSEKRAGQDVSLGVQNGILADLLEHWRIESPDVVAHDFGGTTALRAHLLNGCDYRSLTLIDPVAIGPTGSALVQAAKDHEAVFSALPAYIHRAILDAYLGGAVHRRLAPEEMDRYRRPWLGEAGQAAFYRQIAQMHDRFTAEIEDRFAEIQCPVSIVWGAEDEWIPLQRGRMLADRIPGARLRIIPQARHLVQEDAPEAIVAAVLDTLLSTTAV